MEQRDIDVLIVGAGPTGLTLACDLARRKVRFRIIDKAPEYFIGSKGKGLQPRSLEVFDDLGIVGTILSLGKFHLPFRGYDRDKVLGERDPHQDRNPTPSTPYASPLIIPQYRVEETLRSLLESLGGHVELATVLVDIMRNDEMVTAMLMDADCSTEIVQARYLVACDGGRSFVRKFLNVSFEGETWKEERMYVGDVRLTGLDREAWHAWAQHPEAFLTLCPLPSTDKFQLQAAVDPKDDREPSLELFQDLVKQRTGRTDIVLTDATWLSLYKPNVRMVSQYRIGNIFLAGDAAHVHSPAGGQGMNTGVQDGYNLGWKLERVLQGAPDSLLDTYEEERLPIAAMVLGISTKLFRQMMEDDEERLRGDARTLQLGISYKGQSLSEQGGDTTLKVASGDRAPDAPGQNADGSTLRLFDLLRGPQFTLLHVGDGRNGELVLPNEVKRVDIITATPSAEDPSDAVVFVDDARHFAEAYGGSDGTLVLVRPDGYIGWIGQEKDADDLRAYLKHLAIA